MPERHTEEPDSVAIAKVMGVCHRELSRVTGGHVPSEASPGTLPSLTLRLNFDRFLDFIHSLALSAMPSPRSNLSLVDQPHART